MTNPDERIQKLLKTVCDSFDNEDVAVRERQIRQWKKLKYYWAGFQRIWWNEVAHDWKVFTDLSYDNNDNSYYDKPVNIFRAYLESIIAALSITIPSVKCFPDDAEDDLDLATARAGDKIADLISKHNDVGLLWLHALFIYCTEGMVACYNYSKEDYKFGEYSEPKTEESEEDVDYKACPDCNMELIDNLEDQFDPGQEDVNIDDLLKTGKYCPACEKEVEAITKQKKLVVTRIVGTTTKPKTRQCMEVYGGLYVKIANYAMKQDDLPYLKFSYETHYSNAIERYPDLKDKFTKTSKIGPGGTGGDPYEKWGRISTQYFGEYPINTATISNWWLRPSAFNVLSDKEDVKELKKLFPDGCKVVFVNDLYAESENECLDDCWTLTNNPLSDYIHFDPLGLLLTSVQEITNDLISLILQTIEHGIPQTFASPDILNFAAYEQMEVSPGSVVPTKPGGGKAIGDGFFTIKTATLSGEVLPFSEKIEELGQLTSGALPSLFGGVQAGGGKTAAQYSMSRAQAQQRLGNTWKMFIVWWKNIFGKAIPAYIKDIKDDERFVQQDPLGNFVNVFIRKAELEGKIGSVELESSEELPSTWSQKKDVIMQLLQGNNPEIMAALGSPENLPLLAEAIGLDDFALPGEQDREKQFEEIKLLVNSGPIPSVGPNGQQIETSSVPIEPDVDNSQVQADICKAWLVGPSGRLCKISNEQGYKNVLLHLQEHLKAIPPPPMPQTGNAPAKKGAQGKQNAAQ